MGGRNFRQFLSAGLNAMPVDADGVPFDMSHIYASGNIAGDMYANITAEGTGRNLATRLYHMTDDPGMRDMLAYLIARDTMHQNQWKAVLEELEEKEPQMPVPNSFPQKSENQDFSYVYLGFTAAGAEPPAGRWSEGPSVDGKGTFSMRPMEPMGDVPVILAAAPGTYPQKAQLK
jgi:Mn-containing catalase